LPRAALDGGELPSPPATTLPARVAFADPDPFQTLTYPTIIAAKLAIADEIGMALAKVTADDRAFIDALVSETLSKDAVLSKVRARFKNIGRGSGPC
jgi:hypothetical protein